MSLGRRWSSAAAVIAVSCALLACGSDSPPGGGSTPAKDAGFGADGSVTPTNDGSSDARVDAPADVSTSSDAEASGPNDANARDDASTSVDGSPSDAPAVDAGGTYDVVVYGATAAGVIAAVAASREGARVVLIEPGRHLGGMVSGGLGWTDFGNKAVIGGMSLGFFQRAGKKYNTTIAWTFEPHVAESIFQDLVTEEKIPVVFGQRLREKTGTDLAATRLLAIHTEDGATYRARVFLDASYGGDLMAQAKVI